MNQDGIDDYIMTVYQALKNNEDVDLLIVAFEKVGFSSSDIFLIMTAGKQLYQDFINSKG